MGRKHSKSLDDRIQEAIADARERKRRAKRKYKSDWETAKNRRLRKAEKDAAAAQHQAAVEAAVGERKAFEAKYADVGIVKPRSLAKIKRAIPKPQLKTAAELAERAEYNSLYHFRNRDTIKAKRNERERNKRARRAAQKAKKAALKRIQKEDHTL